jgi:hypothetical protein
MTLNLVNPANPVGKIFSSWPLSAFARLFSISGLLLANSVPIHADSRQKKSNQRTSATPISKSIKTHLFPTTFNQNHTRIVQNHTKTILLFNTFYQNFFLFAFLRCREISPIQRTYPSRRSLDFVYRDEDGRNPILLLIQFTG